MDNNFTIVVQESIDDKNLLGFALYFGKHARSGRLNVLNLSDKEIAKAISEQIEHLLVFKINDEKAFANGMK